MTLERISGLAGRAPPMALVGAEHGFAVLPAELGRRPPQKLALQWAAAWPPDGAAFELSALLDWRRRLAPAVVGREAELAALVGWARTGRGARLRLVTGPAGVGKSRLAAALAEALPDWQAGGVALTAGASVSFAGSGLLIVLDRPEATPEAFRTLLRQAARAEALSLPVRFLALSRRPLGFWREDIAECDAAELCAAPELALGPLAAEPASHLFRAALTRLGDRFGAAPLVPSDDAFAGWLARRPALHGLPLMVQAAALHCACGGDLKADGPAILAALARRERAGLDRAAAGHGWTAPAASRLVGLVQVRDTLDPPALRRLAAPALGIGMPAPHVVVAAAAALRWWAADDAPDAPPDLFAAALLRDVLDEAGAEAANWIWAMLGDRGVFQPELVARRAEDWAALYGDAAGGLSGIVAGAIGGRPERADRWRPLLDAPEGERRLALVAAAVGRGLLAQPGLADAPRALILLGIADRLWDSDDRAGAVAALRETVALRQHLAEANPDRFDVPLAQTLATLSNRLGDTGDAPGAVAAIGEAVAVCRRLALRDPARFEPELAHCLGLLSSRLSEADDGTAALAAIEAAMEIRRRLAHADPRRWEHDLSAGLNALSIRRSDIGDRVGAMAATQEGVALRRRLTRTDPARYEPGLAQSLHNLAIRLVEVEDGPAALAAAQEAVSIRRRLAQAAPARSERDLTQSLQNLSHRLSEAGDFAAALTAIRECVAIRRRLAQPMTDRAAADLAEALVILSQRLADAGDHQGAVAPIREAIALRRRLATDGPARSEPMLAQALHLLGDRLGMIGERAAARAALKEALEIRGRLAATDPARYATALAASKDSLAELLALDTPNAGWSPAR